MKSKKLLNRKLFILFMIISLLLETASEYLDWFREMYTLAYTLSMTSLIIQAIVFIMIIGMILVVIRNQERQTKDEIVRVLISICIYLIYCGALTLIIYGIQTLAE